MLETELILQIHLNVIFTKNILANIDSFCELVLFYMTPSNVMFFH
jgi:hypothetical protein